MDDYTRKFNAAEDKDQQVHYILTTVYESLKEKGYDPRTDFNIHTIIVAGEAGGSIPSTRESIENLWGAKVVDFYGLSDI